ncbi:MAG: enoyl-CoA hydratase/isomerase family protein [Halanaerobiales bacterium]|nr:enoyl-CoA hydratase/isomerase family protein [Halanaerobiales bacterium]
MKKRYKVGIIGAGTMGAGIGQKMAQEGIEVTLLDINEENLKKGLDGIKKMLDDAVKHNVFSQKKADTALKLINKTTSYDELVDMDLVIEAVYEDMDLKRKILKKLDNICKPKTILASNTSSLSITELAESVKRKDKFLGMHYFFHPAKNRLLEIVSHKGTSQETVEKAQFIGKLHGKTMITIKDAPGFVVNRFFMPYYIQSIRALEEGVANIPTIEKAAKDAFGLGMGPFELINVSGLQVSADAPLALIDSCGDFYTPPKILVEQAKKGKPWDLKGKVKEEKIKEVQELLYGAVFGTVCKILDENIATVEQIDRGAKVGLRWKEGPFELINKLGIDKAYNYVKKVKERYPDLEFKMPKSLKKHYKTKEKFKFNFVDTEFDDGIAYITINRPEAMNALNDKIFDQLTKEFDQAEKNSEIDTVVLMSTGKEFVAGADIKYFIKNIENGDIDKTVEFTKRSLDLLRRFETSSKLTIAVVDGLSLGGGSELALACQAIIATPKASFGFPETGIGIFPGNGGMIRLERHLGPELAKYFVLTGKTIRAKEAKELGIIDKLVDFTEINQAIKELKGKDKVDKYEKRELPKRYQKIKEVFSTRNIEKLIKGNIPDDLDQEFAGKMIKILSSKAPIALKKANKIIDQQKDVSIDQAMKIELDHNAKIMQTEDALLGLKNVGREVEFKGK